MATDVKLDQSDGTFLELHGRVVKSVSSDFMLDSAERRKGSGPFRRALVHDQNDGLTINFAGDYLGGTTLNAVREISPLHKKGAFAQDPRGFYYDCYVGPGRRCGGYYSRCLCHGLGPTSALVL